MAGFNPTTLTLDIFSGLCGIGPRLRAVSGLLAQAPDDLSRRWVPDPPLALCACPARWGHHLAAPVHHVPRRVHGPPHFVLRYRQMRPEVARNALLATHGGLSLEWCVVPYQRRAQHAGQWGVEVEGGRVPTPDWMLNLQILTSGGFR